MKRFLSLFLTLCLMLALLVPGAMAASDTKLTYDLSVDGSNSVTVEAGSTVTATFRILSDQDYSVLSMQNEIVFDTDFFTLVSASAVKSGTVAAELPRTTDEANHQSRIKATGMNSDYAAEETVCTVQLQVKSDATGSSTVRCEQYKARDNENQSIDITAQDLTVTVGSGSGGDVTQEGSINIGSFANGSVTADKSTAKAGDPVTLTVRPDEGYQLDTLTVTGATVTKNADGTYTFTMPEGDVTVTATFKKITKEYTITITDAMNGSVSASTAKAAEGTVVMLYITPASGYALDTLTVFAGASSVAVIGNGFVMPAADVVVYATFKKATADTSGMDLTSAYWDGISVDVSWYLKNPGLSTYTISTAAEFAGVAALVNGLVNNNCKVYTGDAVYTAEEWNSGSYVNADIGTTGGNNLSTANFRYGITRFNGTSIYLLSDLNMSGGNWMPIGGAYLMTDEDTSTKVGGSFCGVLDGQNHNVTIYCDRHCSGNYGDGANVGLIGRIGAHDDDPESWRPSSAGVRNIAVYGSVKGNRSVGGVVGKIGRTTGTVVIETCANYATVTGTDAKGTGGIVGAGWNLGEVRNCYNTGTITNTGNPAVGGIVGSCEIPVINCYNVGKVVGVGTTASIATDNGGSSYENCYWLTGTASVGVYNKKSDQVVEKSSAEMKTAAFVAQLGSAYAMDTKNINNGYPVFGWQSGDTASAVIKSETYVSGGTAITTVTDKAVDDSIAAVKKYGTDMLYIQSDPSSWAINGSKIQISKTAAANIGNNGLNLQINAADGTRVILDSTALRSIALKATGSTIEIVITPKTQAEAAQEIKTAALTDAELKNSVIAEVTVWSNGKAITDFSGTLTIQIPVNKNYTEGSGYPVMQVGADGTAVELSGRCVKLDGVLYVQVYATAPGTFIVLQGQKQLPFTDVDGHWAYDAIEYVYFNGLFDGTGDGTTFSPNGNMTRSMLVTVLYRLEGEPAVTGTSKFPDVKSNQWYTDAVIWATKNNIVTGYDNGQFGTNDNVTREQIATILYRYAAYKEYNTTSTINLTKYTDASAIGSWALTAMKWANAEGLITGRTTTTLVPQGTANRAEVATILMRFCENIVK